MDAYNIYALDVARVKALAKIPGCVVLAGVFALASCETPHTKFKPGDRVRYVHSEGGPIGTVYSRVNTNKPYYYVRFPGPGDETNTVDGAHDGAKPLQSHIEGPFEEADLEFAHR